MLDSRFAKIIRQGRFRFCVGTCDFQVIVEQKTARPIDVKFCTLDNVNEIVESAKND
jgi:hypothetical protein